MPFLFGGLFLARTLFLQRIFARLTLSRTHIIPAKDFSETYTFSQISTPVYNFMRGSKTSHFSA
jgi:hypothetical protein